MLVKGLRVGCRRYYEPTQREKYLATLWLVEEGGFIYLSAAIVQLVTNLLQMNAGVIMEFILSQLIVRVFSFFLRVVFPHHLLTHFFLISNGSDDHRSPCQTRPRISRCLQHSHQRNYRDRDHDPMMISSAPSSSGP